MYWGTFVDPFENPVVAGVEGIFVTLGVLSLYYLTIERKNDFRYIFSVSMLVTLIGAYADAVFHLTGIAAKEGFFTPAHAAIYTGVLTMILGVYHLQKHRLILPVTFNTFVAKFGLFLMSAGGAWDFAYHSIYGFTDIVAWTPPHLTVTAGFAVLMVSAVIQFGKNSNVFVKTTLTSSVLLFVALWTTVVVLSV
jgi:hypothetical protein